MKTLPLLTFACALSLASIGRAAGAPEVALTRLEDRVRIEIGGQLFSEYIFASVPKPHLYPILTADGTGLTRNFPMVQGVEGEERDHPHHRGLWFGHGLVNGHDFWLERATTGRIVHDTLLEQKAGPVGVIRASNRWELPDGKVVCTDERTIRIQQTPEARILDFEITISASHGPVVFGDTKEGMMSIRINESMRLTRRENRKSVPGVGHIVNSEGVRDGDTWGKRAAWVDYFAPVDGKVMGVAVFDHPKNPRHPTWWHVRDYGLFAANPFGVRDFERLENKNAGDLTVPDGGSVTFRYRFYFHSGDAEDAKIAEHYRDYAGKE